MPHRLVGRCLPVHYCQEWVKVFDGGERVAFHRRENAGRFRTEREHLPERKSHSTEAYTTYMLNRCREIGPACRSWAEAVLEARSQLGLRALQGVVRLQRKYTNERIDNACRMATGTGSVRYHTVELLCRDSEEPSATELLTTHELIRPLGDYQLHLDNMLDNMNGQEGR